LEQTYRGDSYLIRGLSPFPGAFTYLNDKMLKIYRGEKEILESGQTWTSYRVTSKPIKKLFKNCLRQWIYPYQRITTGRKKENEY